MSPTPLRAGVFDNVIAHVSGEVRVDLLIEHRAAAFPARTRHQPGGRRRRSRAAGRSIHHRSTLEDPDSSSIAGRRASGFLQVSLSKVSRHPHRGARPASSAETPPTRTSWTVKRCRSGMSSMPSLAMR